MCVLCSRGVCSSFQLFFRCNIWNHNIDVMDWVLSINFFFSLSPHFSLFPWVTAVWNDHSAVWCVIMSVLHREQTGPFCVNLRAHSWKCGRKAFINFSLAFKYHCELFQILCIQSKWYISVSVCMEEKQNAFAWKYLHSVPCPTQSISAAVCGSAVLWEAEK